ncbi:MAG: hypothetical protein AMXMBFR58_29550 [Phycisphaerae bacterium]
MATVRERIQAEIVRRFEALADVGAIFEAAEDIEPTAVAEITRGGEHVFEMVYGNDETPDPESAHRTLTLEPLSFEVAVLVHLKEDALEVGEKWSTRAADICAAIYGTYASPELGQWTPPAGAPLAIKTDYLGGGGVALSDRGTRTTLARFQVHYRHKYGDPTVPK